MINMKTIRYTFLLFTCLFCAYGGWAQSLNETFIDQAHNMAFKIINQNPNEVAVISDNKVDYSGDIVIPPEVQYKGQTFKVTTIKDHTFKGSQITSLDLNEVTTIEGYALENTKLVSIDLKKVTKMGDGVFYNNRQLEAVHFRNLTQIPSRTFGACGNLKLVQTSCTEPPSGTGGELNSDLILDVPDGSETAYSNHSYWKRFTQTVPMNVTCSELGEFSFSYFVVNNRTTRKKYPAGTFEFTFRPENSVRQIIVTLDGQEYEVTNNKCTLTLKENSTLSVVFSGALTLNDATNSYMIDQELTCDEVIYKRNYKHTNWQPLYIPFALDYDDWSAHFDIARLNNVHQYDDNNDGFVDRTELEIIRLTKGSTKANMPYLIRAKEIGEQVLSKTNTLLYPAVHNSIDCFSFDTRYTITGTYTQYAGTGHYVMFQGALRPAAGPEAGPGAFRWYLNIGDVESNQSNAPKRIYIREKGDLTAIESMDMPVLSHFDIYDINGRKVKKNAISTDGLRPGVYIINGKKVLL